MDHNPRMMPSEVMRRSLETLRPFLETGYQDQSRFRSQIDGALRHAVGAGLAAGEILRSQTNAMDWTTDDGAAAYEGLRVASWLTTGGGHARPEHVKAMIAGLEAGLRMHVEAMIAGLEAGLRMDVEAMIAGLEAGLRMDAK